MEIVQLTTTVDSEDRARTMAESMVAEGLAACAQVQGPVTSFYRWHGRVDHAVEWYCHFKTSKQQALRLRNRLVSLHPYEVPEVIVLPIVDGHDPYLAWVAGETKPTAAAERSPSPHQP